MVLYCYMSDELFCTVDTIWNSACSTEHIDWHCPLLSSGVRFIAGTWGTDHAQRI